MTKGTIRSSLYPLLATLLMMLSCNSNVIFTDSVRMEENTWKLHDVPVYRVDISDTTAATDILFSIRTGPVYPFRNIFLFVTTTSPDGKSITDTLTYDLADEKGKWYGKGLGDINELRLPYKSNVFFPVQGTYQFRVQHGMRAENLKGVYDFGMRVEKKSR